MRQWQWLLYKLAAMARHQKRHLAQDSLDLNYHSNNNAPGPWGSDLRHEGQQTWRTEDFWTYVPFKWHKLAPDKYGTQPSTNHTWFHMVLATTTQSFVPMGQTLTAPFEGRRPLGPDTKNSWISWVLTFWIWHQTQDKKKNKNKWEKNE